MTKDELAAAMAAFEQGGGKVEQVATGLSGNPDPSFNTTIRFCACGCHGDWTEHRMREAEGKFADQ